MKEKLSDESTNNLKYFVEYHEVALEDWAKCHGTEDSMRRRETSNRQICC